ncbi:MAG TPA: hypothetical protein VFV99_03505 [Kofleriaceae bacterium]|nr:hypothetical protein [Kofleriaceae bacterium]
MLRLSVIALLVVGVSCGGRKMGAKAPATPSESAPAEAGAAPSILAPSTHDEIEKLDAEITASRQQLKLDEPTEQAIQAAPTQALGAMPSTQDTKCHPAQNDTCKTSCTLSDSICSNANKICNLANSMPGDNWAMNKCAKANTTCESSKTKCCGCQ